MGKRDQRVITFDDAKRKDFLTGFRKRKKERRDFGHRKAAEETKKQQKEDRLEQRRFKRAQRMGVGVDDLDAIDEQLNAALQAEEEEIAPPGADVTTYEEDGTLTTAVITPLLDDDADEPPLLHGGSQRGGASHSGSQRGGAAQKKPVKLPNQCALYWNSQSRPEPPPPCSMMMAAS